MERLIARLRNVGQNIRSENDPLKDGIWIWEDGYGRMTPVRNTLKEEQGLVTERALAEIEERRAEWYMEPVYANKYGGRAGSVRYCVIAGEHRAVCATRTEAALTALLAILEDGEDAD